MVWMSCWRWTLLKWCSWMHHSHSVNIKRGATNGFKIQIQAFINPPFPALPWLLDLLNIEILSKGGYCAHKGSGPECQPYTHLREGLDVLGDCAHASPSNCLEQHVKAQPVGSTTQAKPCKMLPCELRTRIIKRMTSQKVKYVQDGTHVQYSLCLYLFVVVWQDSPISKIISTEDIVRM